MKIATLLFATILLTACSSASYNVKGQSAVDERLKKDTYRMFTLLASTQMKCDDIEYADVTSSEVSGDIASETWVAHGCGKTAPYTIDFVPSPMGGYTYHIKQKQ